MRGHVAAKRGRYYCVVDIGPDPVTGRRRQRWHAAPDGKGFTGKRDAERALRELLTKLDRGEYVDPSTITVGHYLTQWVEGRELRPSTRELYRVMVRAYVVPRVGSMRLQKVTGLTLSKLYADLATCGRRDGKGLAAKTRQNVHTMLHRAFSDAMRTRYITHNPAEAVDPPRVARRKMRPWTVQETARFLEAAAQDRLSAAFVLVATTGMRRGECLGLQWDDVDLEAGTVSVQRTLILVNHSPTFSEPKTDAGRRSIPLAPEAVAVLRGHRKAQAAERLALGPDYQDGDLVFCREDGTPMNPDRLLDTFRAIAKRAGVRRVRLHDLRHGFATRALEAGVPAKVVQDILGHSSITMTLDLYSHAVPSMQKDATALVAGLIYRSR
jgi:integrase